MQNHDATSKGEANICLGGGKHMFVRPVLVMLMRFWKGKQRIGWEIKVQQWEKSRGETVFQMFASPLEDAFRPCKGVVFGGRQTK